MEGLRTLLSLALIVGLITNAYAQDAQDAQGPAASGAKKIAVDLDRQVLTAYEGEEMVHEFDAVTGSCAKWTHPGTYQIMRKVKDYTSKTYGSKMPYTMFFTDDGKAIHGTSFATVRSYLHSYVSDSVGSKGCVGLGDDDAKTMFEWAPKGTTVVILPSERNPDEIPGHQG
jgi:lipoprotein-anchoring transpeptidase ErfK/SrfK